MKNIALVVLAFHVGCILCSTCEAMPIPLGEIQRSSGGGNHYISYEIEIEWWSGSDIPIEPIMTWGRLGIVDVGTTVTLSSGTSAEFDHYSAMLTSGTDDLFWILVNMPPLSGRGG